MASRVRSVAPSPARPTIGFLRHYFLPPSETFIYTSLGAAREHHDVRVFAMQRLSAQKFPDDQVTALRDQPLGRAESLLYRVTTWSPRFFRWASGLEIMHAHMGWTGAHGLLASRRLGVPLVTSFYGQDVTLAYSRARFLPEHWHYALLMKRLFAEGERFLVLSGQMRDALVAQGAPMDRVRVVPLGIDLSRFERRARRKRGGQVTVLMVGREVEKKGFDDGLRACARARDAGADLRVVLLGTGAPGRGELGRLAASLDLDVHWADPTTPAPEAMAEADVLLAPSRTARNGDQEGTPTVICEAGAAELAVVSTFHAGIPEQVAHERTGLLAAERDVDGLAAHLLRLAKDPDLRVAMGRAARAKMRAEYSREALARNLRGVYAELL